MNGNGDKTLFQKMKSFFIGDARNINDPRLFHKLSLVVFFAWVGLGSDGITSSCYGPEEAFLALKAHPFLGVFVALLTIITIFVISSSYSQIVELFPAGGGGYLAASKLLSPSVGMVSGCALMVDYLLTITLSIASGTDALFSFLPLGWYPLKLEFAACVVIVLIVLNMRGVKESVAPLIPIFLVFMITHAIAIIYAISIHAFDFGAVASATAADIHKTRLELGTFGMILLILRAYSMGAGTYTGIEAVSNGIPMLKEPRVETAKKTMRYMALSLSFMVGGLMIGYLLYGVGHQPGKTLNAVLLNSITEGWPGSFGKYFVLITLISEAVLLYVAAQTGFLGGPRVLSNMAKDQWFPSQFAILSERFVTQNGILLMGAAAFLLMIFSRGSVRFLVVLYSINVFITFVLSQLGMVRHWWAVRKTEKYWKKRITVNGVGLILTVFILLSVVIIKFNEGGWITMFITGSLIWLAVMIKRHYRKTAGLLKRLDELVDTADLSVKEMGGSAVVPVPDPGAKTAVILVNGYNGLGLHTLFNIIRLFKDTFRNFIFVQVGVIDAGNFKGLEEISKLKEHIELELKKYVAFMQSQGFYSESFHDIGVDVVETSGEIAGKILEKYPQSVFFGGQIVFPRETFYTRMLHHYTIFAIQRNLYHQGIPVFIMPIRVNP